MPPCHAGSRAAAYPATEIELDIRRIFLPEIDSLLTKLCQNNLSQTPIEDSEVVRFCRLKLDLDLDV